MSLKLQCLHPFSQSKISLLLKVTIQVSFVMHLGPLGQLCFESMSPVVSAQTAVYWSLPTSTEMKLENTDMKLAMIVGVQQKQLTLLCSLSRLSIRYYIGSYLVMDQAGPFFTLKNNYNKNNDAMTLQDNPNIYNSKVEGNMGTMIIITAETTLISYLN